MGNCLNVEVSPIDKICQMIDFNKDGAFKYPSI
jgi:hypothetical protein